MSDIASKLASNIGTDQDITLDDMIGGRPTPQQDLVQAGWRTPRFVKEAVRLAAMVRRAPEQDIVVAALMRDPDLRQYLIRTHRKANEA
jgi:hypothetical protein